MGKILSNLMKQISFHQFKISNIQFQLTNGEQNCTHSMEMAAGTILALASSK